MEDSTDKDMRMAIATILLEHLFEYDFEHYFEKVREQIQNGRLRFIDTLEMCAFFDQDDNERKVKSFLRNAKRGVDEGEWTS